MQHDLIADRWDDYTLIDSGKASEKTHPMKLERFGRYTVARPDSAAGWRRALPSWDPDGYYELVEHNLGDWKHTRPIPERWEMTYRLPLIDSPLRFYAACTPYRHMGVFPEQAAHWDWFAELIGGRVGQGQAVKVLNLFAYTGLASLAAAAAGAQVTHVDSSKKSVQWGRDNQALSGLADRPIRWIVDDALKFTQREARRDSRYDGVILDPPPFGHGPKGEVWKLDQSLPVLLKTIRAVLSDNPLFIVITAYSAQISVEGLHTATVDLMRDYTGNMQSGHLTARDQAGRTLPLAMYARWRS